MDETAEGMREEGPAEGIRSVSTVFNAEGANGGDSRSVDGVQCCHLTERNL